MRKKLLTSFFILLSYFSVFSQDDGEDIVEKKKYEFVPAIGAGIGFSKFYGDVEDKGKSNVHYLGNKLCYNAAFRANISRSFFFSLDAIFGKLSGNENSKGSHRNFQSEIFSAGLNIEYNFAGFYRKKKAFITPYLGTGFYYVNFKTRTDIYDENGNLYYYWSDGKIRDVAENAPNADNAQRLSRDYNFETPVNPDPLSAFTIPVSGGIEMHLSQRFVFRLNSQYFFAFNDKIDGFNTKPSSKNNDGYFYNSVSVFFNLIPDRSDFVPKELARELDTDDYDGDGVTDVEDECGGTKAGIPVNKKGCPFDTDNDGIPDYLDKQPESPTTAVGVDGVLFDYLKIAQDAADSISILHALLDKYPNLFLKSNAVRYTVHIGTFNQTTYAQKLFLQSIPGVKETQLNDSVFVYSVGGYDKFEDAEEKKVELQIKGIESAFEVPENELKEVAGNLGKIKTDKVETPGERMARVAQAKAEEEERNKYYSDGESFVQLKVEHSEEKGHFEQKVYEPAPYIETAETKKKTEQKNLNAEQVEKLVEGKLEEQEAKPVTREEKKVETTVAEEVKGSVAEEKRPEIKEKEVKQVEVETTAAQGILKQEERPKSVVKFMVNVVEYVDKPLPFSVLLVMQREGVEVQNSTQINGKIFTVGNYNTVKDAEKLKAEVLGLGVNEVVVIGSVNGQKVTQVEAERQLRD